jgi:hypothetical protein
MESRYIAISCGNLLIMHLIHDVVALVYLYGGNSLNLNSYLLVVFFTRSAAFFLTFFTLFLRKMSCMSIETLKKRIKNGFRGSIHTSLSNPLEMKFVTRDKSKEFEEIKGQLKDGKDAQKIYQDEFERLLSNLQDLLARRDKKLQMIEESVRAIEELSMRMRDCMLILETLDDPKKSGQQKSGDKGGSGKKQIGKSNYNALENSVSKSKSVKNPLSV